MAGLERVSGKTFRWKGEYSQKLNEAHTLDTQLNVFQNFQPKLPEKYKEVKLSDLKADIDSLEGKKVKIQSLAEMFNFILMLKQEKMDPAPLSVNVNRLSHNDIKHLREECNKGCQVTVYGKVGDIMGNEKGIIADVIEW